MPVARLYKANSVIYFEGEKAENIYVLRKGKVSLRYFSIEETTEKIETLKPGEFFGVKSVLGKFPREETAVAAADCDILVLTLPEFEKFSTKNFDIIMKMLKIFSTQLRSVGKQVRKYLTDDISDRKDVGLFKIGEYYLKNNKFNQAIYAYSKYTEYYPEGEFFTQAKERIESARKGIAVNYSDISTAKPEVTQTPSTSSEQAGTTASGGDDTAKKYYEAVSLFSQNKFEDAIIILTNIIEQGQTEENKDLFEKTHFQIGKCYMKMKDFDNAIDSFKTFARKFPSSTVLKEVVFNMGLSYEETGDLEKAKAFYNKVVDMGPDDNFTAKAKNKIKTI